MTGSTEETIYRASHDPFVLDPRDPDDGMDLPPMYSYGGQGGPELAPDDALLQAFDRVLKWATGLRRDPDRFAQKVVARWAGVFHPNLSRRVYLFQLHGYVQSDWWALAVSAESLEEAVAARGTLEMWYRGDTYHVEQVSVTECPGCGARQETVDEAVGGIYAHDEEEAIRIFREGF